LECSPVKLETAADCFQTQKATCANSVQILETAGVVSAEN